MKWSQSNFSTTGILPLLLKQMIGIKISISLYRCRAQPVRWSLLKRLAFFASAFSVTAIFPFLGWFSSTAVNLGSGEVLGLGAAEGSTNNLISLWLALISFRVRTTIAVESAIPFWRLLPFQRFWIGELLWILWELLPLRLLLPLWRLCQKMTNKVEMYALVFSWWEKTDGIPMTEIATDWSLHKWHSTFLDHRHPIKLQFFVLISRNFSATQCNNRCMPHRLSPLSMIFLFMTSNW